MKIEKTIDFFINWAVILLVIIFSVIWLPIVALLIIAFVAVHISGIFLLFIINIALSIFGGRNITLRFRGRR